MSLNYILLPIFVLRLIFAQLSFFALSIYSSSKKYMLSAILFLIFIIYSYQMLNGLIYSDKPQVFGVKSFPFNRGDDIQIVRVNDANLLETEQKLQSLLEISADNRLILINLALIADYKNNSSQFTKSWTRAMFSDPNNNIFKTDI